MEAVEMTVRQVVAAHLAVLQTSHLPDEVDGDVFTLAVHRFTPGSPAAGAGAGGGAGGVCRGAAARTQQYQEEKGWRQHFVFYLCLLDCPERLRSVSENSLFKKATVRQRYAIPSIFKLVPLGSSHSQSSDSRPDWDTPAQSSSSQTIPIYSLSLIFLSVISTS